jgi:lipopolysaccharide transport system permease protein
VSAQATQAASRRLKWIENRPSHGWLPRIDFRELWFYRDLARFLAVRDMKLRYKQTAIGIGWVVLQPLIAMGIFTGIFGHVAKISSQGLPYPVFVLGGLAVWQYVGTGVGQAAQSLVVDRDLVTKTYFPRLLAPIAAVLPGLVDLGVAIAIVAIVMIIASVGPSLALLTLPAWILATSLTVFGAGIWLAALNVLYRDVRYTLPFMVQIWFYASPIVYPSSLVHGTWRWVYSLNPVAGVIDGFRWSLVGAPAPPVQDLLSLASIIVLILTGVVYFRRVERQFADRI